jgi:hypothetical protein
MNYKQKKIDDIVIYTQKMYEEKFISNPNSTHNYRSFVEFTAYVKKLESLFGDKTLPMDETVHHHYIPSEILMKIRKITEKEIREKYNVPDSIPTVYDNEGEKKA